MEKRNIAVIGDSAERLSALKELLGNYKLIFQVVGALSLETAIKKAADVK